MSQATNPPFLPKNDQFKERDQGISFLIEPPGKLVTVIGIFDKTKLDGADKFLQYCMILRWGNIYFAT